MTDALGSIKDCFDGKVVDEGHIELLVVPIERYGNFEVVRLGGI